MSRPPQMNFALTEELKAKQDVVKGRHGQELVLESVGAQAPAKPVPIVQVDRSMDPPPGGRALMFSPGDLEQAKGKLANPDTRSRSPSPAALKGAQKDLVGDLKDVLAAKKKQRRGGGGGHESRKQGPSMARLDKSLQK